MADQVLAVAALAATKEQLRARSGIEIDVAGKRARFKVIGSQRGATGAAPRGSSTCTCVRE